MSALSKTSCLSITADLILVLIVICKTAAVDFENAVIGVASNSTASVSTGSEGPWDFAHSNFMEAFGAICFAFVCHHSSFLVYTSLENPTPARWHLTTHASIGAALVLCLSLAISGYAEFQLETQAKVLNNFPQVFLFHLLTLTLARALVLTIISNLPVLG